MKYREDTTVSGLGDVPENPLKVVNVDGGWARDLYTYKPFFKVQNDDLEEAIDSFSHTFEFYVDGGKLYVRYNNNPDMELKKLFMSNRYPEVKGLFKKIYDHIVFEYSGSSFIKKCKSQRKSWEEVVTLFIVQYLSKYRDPLDVIIRSNGQVIINPEKR